MEHYKAVGEGVSIAILVGTLAKILPAIAATLSIVWYGVLLYDRFFKRKNEETTDKGRGKG